MDDQDLKKLWREQHFDAAPPMSPEQQIATMRKKMAQMHRTLSARDLREFIAAIIVIAAFTLYYFLFPSFLARLGGAIVVAGGIFASWKMFQTRRSTPQPIADAPVTDWLKYELAQIRSQAELSRTVLWWYLLPPYIGTNIFIAGLPNASVAMSLIYALFSGLLYLWVYWLNQRARRKQFLPLERELESLLQSENFHNEKPSSP